MRQYLDLLEDVRVNGHPKGDRTGTGTLSVFGRKMRFDLQEGFPLVTTKRMFVKGMIHELLWFLKGDTDVRYLQEHGVRFWDAWADENGDLGPVYGAQWRLWPTWRRYQKCQGVGMLDDAEPGDISFNEWICPDCRGSGQETIDQIKQAVHLLRTEPDSRRIIVSAWNPADLPDMALAPCHALFQFYSREATDTERKQWEAQSCRGRSTDWRVLSCQLFQRSADMLLGTPFNTAAYALLTMMMAQVTDHIPGEFVHTFGDAHIYRNHRDQVRTQPQREPRPRPMMRLNADVREIDDFCYEDFTLTGYDPHPAIQAPVAV